MSVRSWCRQIAPAVVLLAAGKFPQPSTGFPQSFTPHLGINGAWARVRAVRSPRNLPPPMRVALILFAAVAFAWVVVWVAASRYTCDSDCPPAYYYLWGAWIVLAYVLVGLGIAVLGLWIRRFIRRRRTPDRFANPS